MQCNLYIMRAKKRRNHKNGTISVCGRVRSQKLWLKLAVRFKGGATARRLGGGEGQFRERNFADQPPKFYRLTENLGPLKSDGGGAVSP